MTTYEILQHPLQTDNDMYYLCKAVDNKDKNYYAHVFTIAKLQKYNIEQSIQFNQEIFTDLQQYAFPQHLLQIKQSIPNQKYFTFLTQPYEINLQEYIKRNSISQNQALRIFDHILKAVYSLYTDGYWHKNIRLEHFVKVGKLWKLKSAVYSENTENLQDFNSEYVWYQSHQPPEAYEQSLQKFDDEDFFPVCVWNMGSLLLDLIFSVHKLKNFNVLKRFKDQQFSLEAIGIKNTKVISEKLQKVLAKMLHYNSLKRMKLSQVFKNQFLSNQVSAKYAKRLKQNKEVNFNARIFTGGKSTLSICLQNPQQQLKGQKMMALQQMAKAIDDLENKKQNFKKLQKKHASKLDSQESLFQSLDMVSTFFKKKTFQNNKLNQQNAQNFQTVQELLSKEKFKNSIEIYKTYYDKSELLIITSNKFEEVNFSKNREEIILLSKYAVNFVALVNFYQICTQMQKKVNYLNLNSQQFDEFKDSNQYLAFKELTKIKVEKNSKDLEQIKLKLTKIPNQQQELLKDREICEFLSIKYNKVQFSEIKNAYRKILRVSYDIICKDYNQSQKQEFARLGVYIVYCLTVDKLYLEAYVQENFTQFFEWIKKQPSKYICLYDFQRYLDSADSKILINHARRLLFAYFKM